MILSILRKNHNGDINVIYDITCKVINIRILSTNKQLNISKIEPSAPDSKLDCNFIQLSTSLSKS